MTPLTSVLIVDDEPAVRDLMARWVTRSACAARPPRDADEALASLRRPPLRPRGHRRDDAGTRRPLARQRGPARPSEHGGRASRPAYTELLDADAPAAPIADFLIKPFQRERFALAVDRGRQWRKQALEEVHWHAVLSIELRDRAEQFSTTAERARRCDGVSETDGADGARRRADSRHCRALRARGAVCGVGRARDGARARARRRRSSRRGAVSRHRQGGDARGAPDRSRRR